MDDEELSRHNTKEVAIEVGRVAAKRLGVEHTIHRLDGAITEKNSYGNEGQAIAGALIAILGVLAAGNPESTLLRALSEAAPHLATIPMAISAVGAIIAALSQPPRIGRK